MAAPTFKALVVEREGAVAALRDIRLDELPAGEVVVEIAYSSLNYKDGLAVTGQPGVLRKLPGVPGIDLAGIVIESSSPRFQPGEEVLATGWGLGERHWGGFAQIARVPDAWLLPLPYGLSCCQAMAMGTAGLTAMLCIMALEEHGVQPGNGEIVITGAAGGVGSLATALLAELDYKVVAATRRVAAHGYLKQLGADTMLAPDALLEAPGKALAPARWGGAIDTVGGDLLAGLLRSTAYGGCVAACGLARDSALHTTVFPFILRGVSLIGIDSVQCPQERRQAAWKRLARELPPDKLAAITQIVPLAAVPRLSQQILAGQVRGRVVVDVNA